VRQSADTLVRQALHLPRREARRWLHVPIEQEELVAEANLGLAKAASRFDPSRGTPFTAFALVYVRSAILDVIRTRARRHSLRDGTFATDVSVEELADPDWHGFVHEIEDPRPQPPELVEQREALATVFTLPERERYALLRTVVDGALAETVGDELGCSANRVYLLVQNASARARRRAA
jgi:RNA polymerase sigma factor (sigma-70 family)